MAREAVLLIILSVFIISFSPAAFALERGEDDVLVRVIDSGVGLCCVVHMPGDKFMIYDAGDYAGGGKLAFEKVKEVVPYKKYKEIELLVLSHSDADHLGAANEICDKYWVKRILRAGRRRDSDAWVAAARAIHMEEKVEGSVDINLKDDEYPMGATYRFGDVFVTMVCGFHKPPKAWGTLDTSKERNAGSIVIRMLFNDKSILFCGDAVGRFEGDDPNMVRATERFMLDNADVITIDSDVIIAPHHGADNASSNLFIQQVSPQYVIFSAGHRHRHPRSKAAKRYIGNGVSINKMFRTDLGDDEGADEWAHGREDGHKDKAGDDDIDILIRLDGTIEVEYVNPISQAKHIEINP